jgi:hypothetical protein
MIEDSGEILLPPFSGSFIFACIIWRKSPSELHRLNMAFRPDSEFILLACLGFVAVLATQVTPKGGLLSR